LENRDDGPHEAAVIGLLLLWPFLGDEGSSCSAKFAERGGGFEFEDFQNEVVIIQHSLVPIFGFFMTVAD
jgi:hypothetical protein